MQTWCFILILPVALPSARKPPQCWGSPVKQQNSSSWRQFQASTVCPERERCRELSLTEFPLLCAVTTYFTHLSFKGRKAKSLLEGAGSILRNSLSDKIRAIINLVAYKLNANSTFQLPSPTASPANFPRFAQQPKPSSATQITSELSSFCLGGKKGGAVSCYQVFW